MNVPLYKSLYDRIKSRIDAGDYAVGNLIPSESKLKEEFGVSVITIRRAIHELMLDGFVESRQGIGNLVLDRSQNAVVIGMSSFTSDVESGRLNIVRTLLVDDMISADYEAASKLGVQEGSLLRHLVRLDSDGGNQFSIDEAFIPPSLAIGITSEIAASPLFIHLWQESNNIQLTRTQYDIKVESSNEEDEELLGIDSTIPVLVTEELIFDANDLPAGLVTTRYRGDRCKLSGSVVLVQKITEKGIVGE